MALARYRPWLLGVVLLSLAIVRPVSAISPYALLLYGDEVKTPVVIGPSGPSEFSSFEILWWRAGRYDVTRTLKGDPIVATLAGRPYLKVAIFWGRYTDDELLKPELASQHGRVYLPTKTQPGVVVVSQPDMEKRANPIPADLEGFAAAWTLTPNDVVTLKTIGVPGL